MHDQPPVAYSSEAGCLLRLYWMFLGNALLAFLLAYLIQKHPLFPSPLDAAYLFSLASVVAARYIDIRHMKGETGEGGAPATISDWRKYAALIVAGSVSAWVVVRVAIALFVK